MDKPLKIFLCLLINCHGYEYQYVQASQFPTLSHVKRNEDYSLLLLLLLHCLEHRMVLKLLVLPTPVLAEEL